jgi:hypothetical protein
MATKRLALILAVSMVVAGCATTGGRSNESGTKAVFDKPIDRAQSAAVDALVTTGFDITKKEPTYVEGFRPRKFGLLVGSGGETVGVWLVVQGAEKTEVRVDTTKSLMGIAGQRNWDSDVMAEISKTLSR